jgi:hypothetical protein
VREQKWHVVLATLKAQSKARASPAVAEKFLIADSRSIGTSQTAGSPTVIFSSIPRVDRAVIQE